MCDNCVYGNNVELYPKTTKTYCKKFVYANDVELHSETTKHTCDNFVSGNAVDLHLETTRTRIRGAYAPKGLRLLPATG